MFNYQEKPSFFALNSMMPDSNWALSSKVGLLASQCSSFFDKLKISFSGAKLDDDRQVNVILKRWQSWIGIYFKIKQKKKNSRTFYPKSLLFKHRPKWKTIFFTHRMRRWKMWVDSVRYKILCDKMKFFSHDITHIFFSKPLHFMSQSFGTI